jgi:amino acid adenylation domain-containing protein/non-ribosomal peptide synthase protein (TIGR01720 family)
MTDLLNKYKRLSDSKKDLLNQLILNKNNVEMKSVEPVAGEKYPVSFSQERLWFLNKLYPKDTSYNLGTAYRIKGDVDVERFKSAFHAVIRKHKVLKTGFHSEEKAVYQVIEKNPTLDIPVSEVQDVLPEKAALEEAENLIRLPFDLSTPPLLRLALYRTGKESMLFVLCIHHIVCDAWSMNLIIRDLLSFYEHKQLSGESKWQYIDFALWQRKWVTRERLQIMMQFWKNYIGNAPESNTIPFDVAGRPSRIRKQKVLTIPFPRSLIQRLDDFNIERSYTSFQVLISVFALLLFLLYGQKHRLLGTAVSNRTKKEFRDIAGFFINTLILGFEFENIPLERWLQQTIAQIRNAFANQEIPVEKLLQQLNIERSLDHNPLFQIMFNVQNIAAEKIKLSGCTIDRVPVAPRSRFDMIVNIVQQQHTWQMEIIYQEDLYSKQRIQDLTQRYFYLLEQIVDNPGRMLYSYETVSRDEICRFLYFERNDFAPNDSIPSLFFSRADQFKNNIAIQTLKRTITYQELAALVMTIQSKLVQSGIRAGDRIAVMTRSDENHISALLGCMAAGGVYLPIDFDLPSGRISHILHDANCKQILTDIDDPFQTKQLDSSVTLLHISTSPNKDITCDKTRIEVKSNDPAYLIYTSGSTGKPKGVLLRHKGFLSMILSLIEIIGINSRDRHLRFFSPSFDGSLWEIFFTLFAGATLVIQKKETLLNQQAIEQLISAKEITSMCITPSYMSRTASKILSGLRILISAAEPAHHADAQLLAGCCRYYNLYGPTEASVTATCYRITGKENRKKSIPLGRSIPNVKMVIVHPRTLRLLPAGVSGEILIGGDASAGEYINRPTLTSKKFLYLEHLGGERYYRSGDLGYMDHKGLYHFTGRIDEQIKMRGYRIEPGEIETAADCIDTIEQCCAVLRSESGSSNTIVLYYTAEKEIEEESIRNELATSLPDYMIPRKIQYIESFPLTTSGKIDKNRLPRPVHTAIPACAEPDTENEKLLAACWEKALHIEITNRFDHFFRLGGDSLKIMHVISLLNKNKKHLQVKDFFHHPCLKDLALAITDYQTTDRNLHVRGRVPLTPVQHWFFEKVKIDRHHYNQSATLVCYERVDIDLLDKALNEILLSHDVFRMRFISNKVESYQEVIEEKPHIKTKLYDLRSDDKPNEVINTVIGELQNFRLNTPPLIKTAVFRTSDVDHLYFVLHHLICDYTSLTILVREIDQCYDALKQGQPVRLIQSSSFGTWSKKLAEYSQSKNLKKQIPFWHEMTRDYGFKLPGKAKFDRRYVNFENKKIHLTTRQTARLLERAQKGLGGLYPVILAHLYWALQKWSGNDKVELTIAGHGREAVIPEIQLTNTMGWFSSIIPLKMHPQSHDMQDMVAYITDLLKRMPNNGLGYGVLRYLRADPILVQRQCPETAFVFLGNMSGQMQLKHFSIQRTMRGSAFSPRHHRMYSLEITAIIIDDQLLFNIIYNTDKFKRSEIEALSGLLDTDHIHT